MMVTRICHGRYPSAVGFPLSIYEQNGKSILSNLSPELYFIALCKVVKTQE